jgi:hypothetical protein
VYHGIGQPPLGIDEYMTALGDSSILPIVYKLYYSVPGSRGTKYEEMRKRFDTLKMQGRIPELSIAFTDETKATDSAIAFGARYNAALDSLALICKRFGGAMFVRPGFEFNGPWNAYTPHTYVAAFQKVVERFRAMGAADSCAFEWCYYPTGAANDFDSVSASGALWYPGDSYVDWFSLDCFAATDFDPASRDSSRNGTLTGKGKSDRFLAMARAKNKPVFLSETSAQGINTSADSADGVHDWNTWYAPFFQFISLHPEIRGFNYINWNWTAVPTYATWGDARIENSPYIVANYRAEMHKSKYIHLPRTGASSVDAHVQPASRLPTVFPAPASDWVTIAGRTDVTSITLVDLFGRVLQKSRGANRLSVRAVPPGLYSLRIEHAGRVFNVVLQVIH